MVGSQGGNPISRVGNQVSSREPRPSDHFWFDLGPTVDQKNGLGAGAILDPLFERYCNNFLRMRVPTFSDLAHNFFGFGAQLFQITGSTFGEKLIQIAEISEKLFKRKTL